MNNFMFILTRSGFFSENGLSSDAVQLYLEALMQSKETAVVVARARERYSQGISYLQFAGVLQKLADMLGVTYAECVSKLVNAETATTKLKLLFKEFGGRARRDRMTPSDFSRFCERFDLFVEPTFCHADVHLLFCKTGDKRAVDFDAFVGVLVKVASMLGVEWGIFSSALAVRAVKLGLVTMRRPG